MRFIDFLVEQQHTPVNEDWKSTTAAIGAAGAIAVGGMYGVMQNDHRDSIARTNTSQSSTSTDDLYRIPPTAANANSKSAEDWKFHPDYPPNDTERAFREYAIEHGIKGVELQALLAQARQETQRFNMMIEKTNGQKYDIEFNPAVAKRLGNTTAGDGATFKGRGPLQLTGRWNYGRIAKIIGKPIDKNPNLLNNLETGFEAAIAYWKLRTQSKVDNFSDVERVTKTINPGLHGLDNRTSYFNDQPTQDEARLKAEREKIKKR